MGPQKYFFPSVEYPSYATSGVARIPCALGQEIFLRPPSTKLTEFKLKNWCKSTEEAKAEYLLQLFVSFLSGIKRI